MDYSYKRLNHFKEHLSRFQVKETIPIPQEIYNMIIAEFKKENSNTRISSKKYHVKKCLQKYSYQRYYENINQIIWHINGMSPLSISNEHMGKLCEMYQKYLEAFERVKPPNRTGLLSIAYVIHKLFQILDYCEYLPYLDLSGSKNKLHLQDKLWEKVCQDLGWIYHPSQVVE